MATFPSLNRVIADDRQPDTGLSIAYSPDGNQFGQSLYADEYIIFSPIFVKVSQSDADNLIQFYKDNKTLAFDYIYQHLNLSTIVYECRWMSPGIKLTPQETGTYMAQAFFRGREKP